LVLVLAVAAVVRVSAAIAYPPALFWSDSWNYLYSAFWDWPLLVIPDKPLGYPLLVRVLAGPERALSLLTTAQHIAALATGVIVYALLLRLGISRLVAALAVAVVVFDSYAIALEQHVLAESLFTLALTASVYLAVVARGREGRALAAGASGLLLALAITLRPVAVAAFPIWAGYLV
jgi:Dolichyl-phosphate-mannose-protein mannosyltransferase